MDKKQNLVWMDLEMTGLEPEVDTIIEIATIITDSDLKILAEGPNLAIQLTPLQVKNMHPWSLEHHAASGLTERCLKSKISLADAEIMTLQFIQQWCEKNSSPLCGNSIHQDRRFLYKYMPKLSDFLHYRNIDVSTLKELSRRWRPKLPKFEKQNSHLALDDIHESIAELAYYRSHMLLP